MKKLFIILVLLLIPHLSYADVDTLEGMAIDDTTTIEGLAGASAIEGQTITSGAVDHCTSCTGVADADVLCEDFEGSYLCTNGNAWTEDTTEGTVNEDAAHAVALAACTDEGSKALQIDWDADTSTGGALYTKSYDWGAGNDAAYVKFYVLFVDWPALDADEEYCEFFSLYHTDDTRLIMRVTYEDTPDPDEVYIDIRYYNGAAYASLYGNIPLSTGVWYKIELTAISSTQTITLDIDDVQEVTDSGNMHDVDFDEIWFGDPSAVAACSNMTIQIDNVKVDDDTIPGDCS